MNAELLLFYIEPVWSSVFFHIQRRLKKKKKRETL